MLLAAVKRMPSAEMNEYTQFIFDWFKYLPLLGSLLMLMALDIATGFVAAFIESKLNSSVCWAGMAKKVGILLMVAFAAVLEPGTGGIPVVKMVCGLYCITESLSIIENAARSGIPIPQQLVDALQKLQSQSVTNMPSQNVTIHQQFPAAGDVTVEVRESVEAPPNMDLPTKKRQKPPSVVIDPKTGATLDHPLAKGEAD